MIAPHTIVIDASVAISVVRKEEDGAAAAVRISQWSRDRVRMVVPSHFWLEVANALVRRHGWSGASVLEAIHEIDRLRFETVPTGSLVGRSGNRFQRTSRADGLRRHVPCPGRHARRIACYIRPGLAGRRWVTRHPTRSRAPVRGARAVRAFRDVAVVPWRLGVPRKAARRGRPPGVVVRALPSRHDGRTCRAPGSCCTGWSGTASSRFSSPIRADRISRTAMPATGRSRRASRTGPRRRCSPSDVASSRRRRGRPSTRRRPTIELGSIVQKGGKVVHAWAVEGDLDPSLAHSNEFEVEWPPRSGQRQVFPEIDRVAWFGPDEARRRVKATADPVRRPARGGPPGLASGAPGSGRRTFMLPTTVRATERPADG